VIVLAFDTATAATVVGLRLADGGVLAVCDDPGAGERPGHVTRLLPFAQQLLDRGGLRWADLQRIAVGVGPGTFTGLRIGVATARGLAQSLGVELVGVSTPHALASAALAQMRPSKGGVLAVLDARRGEVFLAAYAADGAPTTVLDAVDGQISKGEPSAPRAYAPAGLPPLLGALRERHGEPWLAVGEGARRYRERLVEAGADVPEDPSPLHRLAAEAICELAVGALPAGSLEEILPDYVRRPDAELALEGATR
jgi:tRNA threonylcarbamoyladenosine biosynthesis protein TsaB